MHSKRSACATREHAAAATAGEVDGGTAQTNTKAAKHKGGAIPHQTPYDDSNW
jgi:hypothetical protein